MSRRNIGDLCAPERKFKPSKWSKAPGNAGFQFETKRQTKTEDAKRAKLLVKASRLYPALIHGERATELAARLTYQSRDDVPDSLASATYYRKCRNVIAGHLWQFVSGCQEHPIATATIIPESWEVSGEDLDRVDPSNFLASFRSTLNRCGAQNASGFLFACLHGEYEPNANVFRPHIHALVGGEMVGVLDRLRKRKGFRTQRLPHGAETDPVFQRVWITREPLTNLPAPITYLMQSFWPARAIYTAEGRPTRQTRKRRIPEPYHSTYLLWADRWKIDDISLLMGLRVTKSGIKPSRKNRTRT